MVSLWQGAGDTRMTCNSSWNTLDNHTWTAFIIFSYYYYLFIFICGDEFLQDHCGMNEEHTVLTFFSQAPSTCIHFPGIY